MRKITFISLFRFKVLSRIVRLLDGEPAVSAFVVDFEAGLWKVYSIFLIYLHFVCLNITLPIPFCL